MSVRVMTWVWEQDIPTTRKMLLLAIADHADDDGDNAWPSKARLAKKVNVTPQRIRLLLRLLEKDGWLITARQQGGTARTSPDRRTNLYKINLERGNDTDPPTVERGNESDPLRGVAKVPSRGNADDPLNIISTSGTSNNGTSKHTEMFDVVMEVCGYDPETLTRSARTAVNRAVRELNEVGATTGGVTAGAKAYRVKFPTAALTPSALAKHFPTLLTKESSTTQSKPVLGRTCHGCEGTGWQEDEKYRTVIRCQTCSGSGSLPPLSNETNPN